MMQIQVIDYQDKDAGKLFVQSLRETGFGVLINHPIQQELVESIYKNWYEYF
ncbi:isopenicillin N synthase family oxygenase, partial [Colwellia sp. BRX8-8]|nr:isopenicillin N synthase family oxygenase [Colwellia sp. BRX8-8]